MRILCGLLVVLVVVCAEEAEDFVCEQDVPYVLDKKYPCVCGEEIKENATLVCDLSQWFPGGVGLKTPYVKEECTLGASWWNECNRCWCRIIGIVCTKKECPKD